jgi:hypothetical protein
MIKSAFLALASAATLAAGSAHAGGVSWSIDINTPVLGTVISNAPVYRAPAYGPAYGAVYGPPPVYVAPPVRYAPVPVYPVAPPVAYYPAPVASVVYVAPGYAGHRMHRGHPGWRHGHRHGDRHGWR